MAFKSFKPTRREDLFILAPQKILNHSIQSKSHKNRIQKICVSQLFAHSFFCLFLMLEQILSSFFLWPFSFFLVFLLLSHLCGLILKIKELLSWFLMCLLLQKYNLNILCVFSVLLFLLSSFNLCFSVWHNVVKHFRETNWKKEKRLRLMRVYCVSALTLKV